jgi:integrase
MAYVVKHHGRWWIRYKEGGKWKDKKTEFLLDDPNGQRKAKRYADTTQRLADARGAHAGGVGPLTVKAYAKPWIDRRREAGLDWKNDQSRLEHHVLPRIGTMLIDEVGAPQIADLAHRWRFATKLAQWTVYNVYSVVSALFRDAEIEGVIARSPCILTKAQLGPLIDSDPEWRDSAIYTRDEAEVMISHPDIPIDRRVYYGFGLLLGLRPGEIAALRWRHYDPNVQPLGKLTIAAALNTRKYEVKGTKTGAVRRVPVHPTLAALLAEWKLSGWGVMMGRQPAPEDLVLPLPPADAAARRSRSGEPIRTGDYAGKKWRAVDLKMLGWRGRELYATKSTFITLAIEDGADPEVIRERITHARARRNAFDGYDRGEHWTRTCAELSKLRLVRRAPEPVTSRVTSLVTARDTDEIMVEAAGVELSRGT